MERLTNHFNYCEFTDCPCYDEELAKENKCKMCDVSTENCYRKSVYDKLRDYEDLEEKGNLKKLPCKNGDIVYTCEEIYSDKGYEVVEYQIHNINLIGEDEFVFIALEYMDDCLEIEFEPKDIGNKVFLTIDEAYKKLEEIKVKKQ